jgi:hypothetical protein
MTSKEKSRELVNKYNSLQAGFYKDQDPSYGYAKQCALIAVDEIIDSYIQEKNNGYIVSDKIILYLYWQEVKQEIINL